MSNTTSYCRYYQARIERKRCWFFTAAIRANEHLAFDRTIDCATSTFEFFVPNAQVKRFMQFMKLMQQYGVCTELTELPNRLRKR